MYKFLVKGSEPIINSHLKTTIYKSVEDIPTGVFTSLDTSSNMYFEPRFLLAFEANNKKEFDFYYIVVERYETPIALIVGQLVNLDISTLIGSYCFIGGIGLRIGNFSGKKPLKLFLIGNTFVSGELGFLAKEGEDKGEIIRSLTSVLSDKSSSLHKEYDVVIFRDFLPESTYVVPVLGEAGYQTFKVDPNMVLTIQPSWKTFDDYLASMKTKFRTKAKSALKRSETLKINDLSSEEVLKNIDILTQLYRSVEKKAEFNLGVLDLNAYVDLKRYYDDLFTIRTYSLNGEVVGFLSALQNGKEMDAHFVGLNYVFNREYGVYQRILCDYVALAIKAGVNKLNYGRTSGEIKSTLGALPQDLVCFLRHKSSITNHLIKPVVGTIKPTEFELRYPFKSEN